MTGQPPAAQNGDNDLFIALPVQAADRLRERSEIVEFRLKEVLFRPGQTIEFAYFPHHGCLSVLTEMADGRVVEVGTIGREGLGGVSLVNDVDWTPWLCLVQIAGQGRRIPAAALRDEMRNCATTRGVLQRYAQAWTNQIGLSGTCNAVHSVEERCARWLLMTHDRVADDQLPLTHELLAIMLGVRRASVTLAAGALQRAGLIRYRHGHIAVVDRAGLEAAACECYAAVRASHRRLLPPA